MTDFHYYEVGQKEFQTFEDAEEYANANKIDSISECGGSWDEFKRCWFCGEFFTLAELNDEGECFYCEQAIKSHGG